jgi:uncharacterized iron-regulated membrane protein
MRTLSVIHRWAGGIVGLLLALLGLTGTILLWEGAWLALPGANDPVVENVATISRISGRAAAAGDLTRITFASEETALHLLTYADGSGAYVRQDGAVVDRWASQWERPELWLFDLHHHLFAGEVGETVTGLAGIAGLLFVITGTLLWLRGRGRFRPSFLPRAFTPGGIVKHHRDLGILVAPLLLLSLTTGVPMVFPSAADVLLSPFGSKSGAARPEPPAPTKTGSPVGATLEQSKRLFPDAALRRVSLTGDAIVVRMKQPFEWTPNGRTQLTFDRSGRLLTLNDPKSGPLADAIDEKLYPIHSAKVGSVWMKLLMSASGLSLAILGLLATYSFWLRRYSSDRMRTVSPTSRNSRKGAQAARRGG